MKQIILFTLVIISSLGMSVERGFAQTALLQQKTVHLFNGHNLDGWYTCVKDRGRDNDPKAVFKIEDGIIHISGEEWGCITTNKEFENYKLVVEYKWGEKTYGERLSKARDNGILFHSTGKDGGYSGIWMHSIECNVIEGGTGDFIVVGDGSNQFSLTSPVATEKQNGSYIFQVGGQPITVNSGRINWKGRDSAWEDVKGFKGKNDIDNPVGEWNRLECIVKGNEILIYFNATLVNHALNVKPSKGRIQIQSEGAEIFYRRVDLIPYPPAVMKK